MEFENFDFEEFGNPPPEISSQIIQSFIFLQKEIFVNVCYNFTKNLIEKDKELYKRATEYSKDYNNIKIPSKLNQNIIKNKIIPNFEVFSNYMFDTMDYVRKINGGLYDECINSSYKNLQISNMPFFNFFVQGIANGIEVFLKLKENGEIQGFDDETK